MSKNKQAIKVILIGAGSRSRAYTERIINNDDIDLIGVVEPDDARRKRITDMFNIKDEFIFKTEEEFFKKGKIADAVIIATMDQLHCRQVKKAIDCSYTILLEKPVAVSHEDCLDILSYAKENNAKILVCHVLRYAPSVYNIKKIIDSGELGKVMSIEHSENVNVFHFSHSYTRGSWSVEEKASPILLAKSCHDLDIITWFANSSCKSISSYGGLSYFRKENAPEGSSERCFDCKIKEDCIFWGERIYLEGYWWNKGAVSLVDQSDEGVRKALKEGPYGRCVFHCDNDVCDHQVCAIEFENGITASFNLSAFTNECNRSIKVTCEKGEIIGTELTIEIKPFAKPSRVMAANEDTSNEGHGGGDELLLADFTALVRGEQSYCRTTIDQSIESHLMAFAGEKSRKEKRMVDMSELR